VKLVAAAAPASTVRLVISMDYPPMSQKGTDILWSAGRVIHLGNWNCFAAIREPANGHKGVFAGVAQETKE
jgi:hypothetical protein